MKTMHLFAGAGGGLLADLILGHEPVVAVEWDGYACQVLRERAADGWFPGLQVWEGDVRLFNPSEYKGKVDCIHAGFPCQDISVAGKQAGVGEETRSGLYREVLRIASVVRPRFLFLENVAAIVTNGLGTVISDLTALGYDTEWLCLRASDCGAKHHRDRWWCRAVRNPEHIGWNATEVTGSIVQGSDCNEAGEEQTIQLEGSCDTDMADAGLHDGINLSGVQRIGKELNEPCECGSLLPNPISARQPGQGEPIQSCYTAETENGEATDVVNDSFPGFWSTEPNVGRVANGVAHRIHRLKALGNGQVPIQAAVAWKLLGGE